MSNWNTASDPRFFEYYARESSLPATVARYRAIHDVVLRVRRPADGETLAVADVGCGAGTQALIWAHAGHRVFGLDVNAPLLDLARQRAAAERLDIQLEVGSATELPWDSGSMDVCLVAELLEHVEDWRACLHEFARILRPRGVLFLSTTNRLCPKQQEFELPLYSWYPARLKNRYVRLARTTRPGLANYATYPAVNWFTFRQLERELAPLGLAALDRFEVMDLSSRSASQRFVINAVRKLPLLRWLAHVATPGTMVVAHRS